MIDSFDGKYRWLSNFWLSPVTMGKWVFPSTENAYQAAKYPKEQRSIFVNISPGESKRAGNAIERPGDWDIRKFEVMRSVLKKKFQHGTYNSILLMDTGVEEIIEGNTWGDVCWGVCDGIGENRLGKMIMEIRDELLESL